MASLLRGSCAKDGRFVWKVRGHRRRSARHDAVHRSRYVPYTQVNLKERPQPDLVGFPGAAMSVEDAVLLGRLIGATTDRSQLGSALKSFEVMRLPRTSVIRAQSMRNRDLWHFDDGERQRERDAVMKRGLEGDPVPDNPCIFGNHVGQRWLYEYDVEKELLSQEVKPLCRM